METICPHNWFVVSTWSLLKNMMIRRSCTRCHKTQDAEIPEKLWTESPQYHLSSSKEK